MQPENSPFAPYWMGVELPGYRSTDYSTYMGFRYDSLPPIDESRFDGSLAWLQPLGENLARIMSIYAKSKARFAQKLVTFASAQAHAADLNLSLPPEFVKLMMRYELQFNLPSATACYFAYDEALIPLLDGYALKFLSDQQDLMAWYLFLRPNEQPYVICAFDAAGLGVAESPNLDAILYAGPSFEAFLYRFWLENTIWFALAEGMGELSPEQQAYCAHYGKQTGVA